MSSERKEIQDISEQVWISTEVKKRMQVYCEETNQPLQPTIEKAISEYLKAIRQRKTDG